MDLTSDIDQNWLAESRDSSRNAAAQDPSGGDDDGIDFDDDIDIWAATRYNEGDKVEIGGERGVVVEVRTSDFEGPDGDVDASNDSPAYVVATQDGAEVGKASDITKSDWDSGMDSPEEDVAQDAEAMLADVKAATGLADSFDPWTIGTLDLEAGPLDFDIPESWEESDTPNRLILLDAWAGMGGQFDCGGACCKGTMMSSGMSDRASDQFCAAMKDRVLMWEGWRRGG